MIGNIAGGLVGPLVNFRAIQADYLTANARQLQSIYNYQRVIINAFTEVINRITMVENYSKSIEIKKQQVERLVASVETARLLYQNAQTEYIDVLFAQRDMWDARAVLIETKQQQLSAVINTYQALGGGWQKVPAVPAPPPVAAACLLQPGRRRRRMIRRSQITYRRRSVIRRPVEPGLLNDKSLDSMQLKGTLIRTVMSGIFPGLALMRSPAEAGDTSKLAFSGSERSP